MGTARRAHREAPYFRAEVGANLLFLGVKAHALAYEVVAATTPHVERHLKAYDKNPLVQLLCPLPQRMLATELHAVSVSTVHI